MNYNLTSFGKPNARKSLFYTLEVTSCVNDTKASSEYIVFKGASIHQTDLYVSTLGNNINNINSDKLLIKLLFHHLKHLESLRERHADRLNSWVDCNITCWNLNCVFPHTLLTSLLQFSQIPIVFLNNVNPMVFVMRAKRVFP